MILFIMKSLEYDRQIERERQRGGGERERETDDYDTFRVKSKTHRER